MPERWKVYDLKTWAGSLKAAANKEPNLRRFMKGRWWNYTNQSFKNVTGEQQSGQWKSRMQVRFAMQTSWKLKVKLKGISNSDLSQSHSDKGHANAMIIKAPFWY